MSALWTSDEVAHVVYAGDFNITGSSDAGYQAMISNDKDFLTTLH